MGPGGVRNSSVAGISFKIPRGLDQRRLKRVTGFQSCWPLDPIAGFKFGHPHKGSAHRKSLIHTGSNCDDHTMLASAHFDPVDSGTGFRKFTFLTGSNNVRNQTALVDSGLWRFETGGQPGMVVCAQKGDRSTYDDGSNCQGCTMNLLAQSRARTNTQYPRRDRASPISNASMPNARLNLLILTPMLLRARFNPMSMRPTPIAMTVPVSMW
jgi:hypothetical protein